MNNPGWKIREYPKLGTFTIQTDCVFMGGCLKCYGIINVHYLVEPDPHKVDLNGKPSIGMTQHHGMRECHCNDAENAQNPGGDKYKLLTDLAFATRNSSAEEIRELIRQWMLMEGKKQVEQANGQLLGLHLK